jgi:hypothetical protein
MEVGDGPTEVLRGGKGTRGRGVRLSGVWMGRGSGQPAWHAVDGCGRVAVAPTRVRKIGEGEPLTVGSSGTVQAQGQMSLIQTQIANGFELYSNLFKL